MPAGMSEEEEQGEGYTDENRAWLKPTKKGALPMEEDSDSDLVSNTMSSHCSSRLS